MTFPNDITEKKFRETRIKSDLTAIRSTIIILATVYTFLIFFDSVLFPQTYIQVSWIRIWLFLPISIAFLCATYTKEYLKHYVLVNTGYFVIMLCSHALFSAIVQRTEYGYSYILLTYVTNFIFAYPVFAIGSLNNLIILGTGILLNMYVDLFVQKVAENNNILVLIAETVIMISFWAIGYFVGNVIEKNRRSVFMLNEELEFRNSQLSQIIEHDWLTNIYNRRAFDEKLKNIIAQALEDKDSFAMIMIDIDYFKGYNDLYGHLEGDECLKRISNIISHSVRSDDIVARYGGEEFAVIVNRVKSRTDLEKVCLHILSNITNAEIPHPGSPLNIVTISMGANFILPVPTTCPEDVINLADKALYSSKKQGKNKYTVV